MTYRELNERSTGWRGCLRAEGVGPEARVGICLERSPKLIMAVLAVLKAGGAYVPLDPAYMQDADERRAVYASGREASLVLNGFHPVAAGSADWAKQSCWTAGRRRRSTPRTAATRTRRPPQRTGPRPLHVRIDRPLKGVMVTHGNLLNA